METVDSRTSDIIASSDSSDNGGVTAANIYGVADINLGSSVTLTARLGYDDVDLDEPFLSDTGMAGFTPGLGLLWRPTAATLVRAALGRTIKRPFVANRTLYPTQLAGFNQLLDDLDGTRSDRLDAGVTQQLTDHLAVGASLGRRWFTREVPEDNGETTNVNDQREDRAQVFGYWTPTERLAVSFEGTHEQYRRKDRDTTAGDPLRVKTSSIGAAATYFSTRGWFFGSRTTWLSQDLEQRNDSNRQVDKLDSGLLIDLFAGWRLPRRYGQVSAQIANVLDRRLSFQDESIWTSTDVNPRFIPERTFLVALSLNF